MRHRCSTRRFGEPVLWAKALAEGNLRGPAAKLVAKLRAFGITSKKIRIGEKTLKGYERAAFEDAWKRYLPAPPCR
jgi:hypothetical protein